MLKIGNILAPARPFLLNLTLAVAMVTSCNFDEMTLFLQSGCKTNTLWTFLIISETHHVPPDFEIYVEWYLMIQYNT